MSGANDTTNLPRLATYFAGPGYGSRPASWIAQCRASSGARREIGSANGCDRASRSPMGTPNIVSGLAYETRFDLSYHRGRTLKNLSPSTKIASMSSDHTSLPSLSSLWCFRFGVRDLLYAPSLMLFSGSRDLERTEGEGELLRAYRRTRTERDITSRPM